MTQASVNDKNSETSEKVLANITPVKRKLDPDGVELSINDDELAQDKKIIEATRLLLREFGIRKSGAAVRDAIDVQHSSIGPREAVSALSNCGFKASFGSIKIKNLSDNFFPLITFQKGGEAFFVKEPPSDGKITLIEPISKESTEVSLSEFTKSSSNFFIIAKQLNDREREERSDIGF